MNDDAPHLTETRWQCLMAFKRQAILQRRPFLSGELKIPNRHGVMRRASGPTLYALERAGWVERMTWGESGIGMPLRSGGPVCSWQLTDAGRNAIAACPDIFPGEPVYKGSASIALNQPAHQPSDDQGDGDR